MDRHSCPEWDGKPQATTPTIPNAAARLRGAYAKIYEGLVCEGGGGRLCTVPPRASFSLDHFPGFAAYLGELDQLGHIGSGVSLALVISVVMIKFPGTGATIRVREISFFSRPGGAVMYP